MQDREQHWQCSLMMTESFDCDLWTMFRKATGTEIITVSQQDQAKDRLSTHTDHWRTAITDSPVPALSYSYYVVCISGFASQC